MSQEMYAVIMAGGKGERFWPLSTSRRPKQLLSLVGDKALLAQAVDRLEGLIPPERIFIITNQDLVEATCAAVPALPAEQIIGEPYGRDTAAAAALGGALVKARNPDAAFCILTADHIIGDLDVFRNTLRESLALAVQDDVLITIGIPPVEPSTGYGYIEAGANAQERGDIAFLKANRFVEKPDLDTAKSYLASGNFYWNSGMFIWSVASLERALHAFRKPLYDMIQRLTPQVGQPDFMARMKAEYEQLEKISIDYAVMEKATNIYMVRGAFAWDDVGSWPALENHFDPDAQGNIVIGEGAAVDSSNNIVVSRDHLTALVGVRDLIVVQSEGVTLVCPKDRAQDVKKLVEQVKAAGQHTDLL